MRDLVGTDVVPSLSLRAISSTANCDQNLGQRRGCHWVFGLRRSLRFVGPCRSVWRLSASCPCGAKRSVCDSNHRVNCTLQNQAPNSLVEAASFVSHPTSFSSHYVTSIRSTSSTQCSRESRSVSRRLPAIDLLLA